MSWQKSLQGKWHQSGNPAPEQVIFDITQEFKARVNLYRIVRIEDGETVDASLDCN